MKLNSEKKVVAALKTMPYVNWDRIASVNLEREAVSVYGWVPNPKSESRMDFVLVDFVEGEAVRYVTSSVKYSPLIAEALDFEHAPCVRMEEVLPSLAVERAGVER